MRPVIAEIKETLTLVVTVRDFVLCELMRVPVKKLTRFIVES